MKITAVTAVKPPSSTNAGNSSQEPKLNSGTMKAGYAPYTACEMRVATTEDTATGTSAPNA